MKGWHGHCFSFPTQVVFWDMRSAWCEHLYRHRVVGGAPFSINIDPVLDGLNQVRWLRQFDCWWGRGWLRDVSSKEGNCSIYWLKGFHKSCIPSQYLFRQHAMMHRHFGSCRYTQVRMRAHTGARAHAPQPPPPPLPPDTYRCWLSLGRRCQTTRARALPLRCCRQQARWVHADSHNHGLTVSTGTPGGSGQLLGEALAV